MDGEMYDPVTGEVEPAVFSGPYRWSQPCAALFTALSLAQAEVENVEKAGTNPAFRSKYTRLGEVLDEVRPKFAAQGLGVVQMPINGDGSNIGVVTLITHKSGQWLESTLYVSPTKFDAQGAGSVITYLRRYALMAMAGVAPDDDDGNAAVGRPSESPAAARTAQERAPAARAAPQRQQAAPAPSATQDDARKRWRELRDEIDGAQNLATLDGISGCLAWVACAAKIAESEGDDKADQLMAMLSERIEGQRQQLVGATG